MAFTTLSKFNFKKEQVTVFRERFLTLGVERSITLLGRPMAINSAMAFPVSSSSTQGFAAGLPTSTKPTTSSSTTHGRSQARATCLEAWVGLQAGGSSAEFYRPVRGCLLRP